MGSAVRLLSVLALVASCTIKTGNKNLESNAKCGDSVLSPLTEVCDDGNTVGGDGCSADCQSDETCGNGVIDETENCDDSNALGGDGCSADCTSDETCGNGIEDLATGETCDDNNLIGGDGCSANCQSNESCGNMVVDGSEACDDGPGFHPACDPDCTRPSCGDGVRNTLAGEECDDNNLANGDMCDSQCRIEQCGNGRKENNEYCDSSGIATPGCDPDCTMPVCGDGTKNVSAGEECDDHNLASGDGCDRYCRTEVCGNGRREDNEACDTGGTSPSCDGDCTTVACGDNFKNSVAGEECDDNNQSSGDGCDRYCHTEVCGNGRREDNEACDTGGDSGSCDSDCTPVQCGDGHINGSANEQCEGGLGCNGVCRYEAQVYYIGYGDILGIEYGDCDGDGNPFTCNGQPTGFQWQDAGGYTPSSIVIEVDHSINCYGSITVGTNLNGTGANPIYFENYDGCTCYPVETYTSVTISGGGYNIGGTNQFWIDGAPSCQGYGDDLGLGGYAKITTYP